MSINALLFMNLCVLKVSCLRDGLFLWWGCGGGYSKVFVTWYKMWIEYPQTRLFIYPYLNIPM